MGMIAPPYGLVRRPGVAISKALGTVAQVDAPMFAQGPSTRCVGLVQGADAEGSVLRIVACETGRAPFSLSAKPGTPCTLFPFQFPPVPIPVGPSVNVIAYLIILALALPLPDLLCGSSETSVLQCPYASLKWVCLQYQPCTLPLLSTERVLLLSSDWR